GKALLTKIGRAIAQRIIEEKTPTRLKSTMEPPEWHWLGSRRSFQRRLRCTRSAGAGFIGQQIFVTDLFAAFAGFVGREILVTVGQEIFATDLFAVFARLIGQKTFVTAVLVPFAGFVRLSEESVAAALLIAFAGCVRPYK